MLTLSQALRDWGPGQASPLTDPVTLLRAAWPAIVGEVNATKSRPERMIGDALGVVTASSAWSQTLSLLQERIVADISARLPSAGIARLRCRVGRVATGPAAARHAAAPRPTREGGAVAPPPSLSAPAALERFRTRIESRRRAKTADGWKVCQACEALVAPGAPCAACANAHAAARAEATARLLFEAPWLGFAGTARLVDGLTPEEYASLRRQLLARWWRELKKVERAKRCSRDGRERSIASSYVVLRSGLAPDRISPATILNALGAELYHLLYGTERA